MVVESREKPVVLVTGAARRVGAAIVRTLHAQGWNVVIHANRSLADARALAAELNAQRAESACALGADLLRDSALTRLAESAHRRWGRLDALVNNASSYYATPLGEIGKSQLDDLLGSNLRAPLLLAQACARFDSLRGIVSIIDVHARKPMSGYSAYTAGKAGLWSLTESLALELAPRVRVNGVAPGHMIWAVGNDMSAAKKRAEIERIPLRRLGGAEEIARAVRFLLSGDAAYITGAVLPVDGGLRLR